MQEGFYRAHVARKNVSKEYWTEKTPAHDYNFPLVTGAPLSFKNLWPCFYCTTSNSKYSFENDLFISVWYILYLKLKSNYHFPTVLSFRQGVLVPFDVGIPNMPKALTRKFLIHFKHYRVIMKGCSNLNKVSPLRVFDVK